MGKSGSSNAMTMQYRKIPSELKKVNSTLGGLRTRILMPIVRMMFKSEVRE